jgi:hypothetical protein
MTVKDIVSEHVKSAQKFEREVLSSPEKARRFLIRAGILDKSGKKMARRFRA